MTDVPQTDAERIEIGQDPLQGEQLYDRDDLWRVLERLGHERGDALPTSGWSDVDWTCTIRDCDGDLSLVDTRMRELPSDPNRLDDGVANESDARARLSEARSSTEPLVVCNDCGSAFEAKFRRLRDPEEYSLPEPRIVETADTLSGSPRIDGTRIGVKHVMPYYKRGYEPLEIAREQYPVLTEEHVQAAIDWAEENPDRLAADRRCDRRIRLRHDVLQSAVDVAVEESLDALWSVMADSRARDGVDPMRPVASHLRNGFQNAGGLNLSVDEERRRIVIDVADEVVARLNDHVDESSTGTEGEAGTDGDDTPDVTERVADEWAEETTPFERVRCVMKETHDPGTVEEIADRARTTPAEARTHLDQLASLGQVRVVGEAGDETQKRYRRDPLACVADQAREVLAETDADELDARIAEMEAQLEAHREEHGVEAPEAAPHLDEDLRREWKTTRRHLQVAKLARTLSETKSAHLPPTDNDR